MMTMMNRMDEILPKHYVSSKDIEKEVFKDYQKLSGINDLNIKYKYVSLARSLKTYGATTYLVKEAAGKKKSVLLAVTRDSLLRLDPDTKVRMF